jgi:hypothetical protein
MVTPSVYNHITQGLIEAPAKYSKLNISRIATKSNAIFIGSPSRIFITKEAIMLQERQTGVCLVRVPLISDVHHGLRAPLGSSLAGAKGRPKSPAADIS